MGFLAQWFYENIYKSDGNFKWSLSIENYEKLLEKINDKLTPLVDTFKKKDIMFKAGKFYLCLKKIDTSNESINSFISTVFGKSYRVGLFYEGRRYYNYD